MVVFRESLNEPLLRGLWNGPVVHLDETKLTPAQFRVLRRLDRLTETLPASPSLCTAVLENEVPGLSYKKEYDAVVTLKVGGRDVTTALEYERMSKSHERYDKIRGECLRRAGGGSVRLSDGQRTSAQVRFLVLSRCEALWGIRLVGDWDRQLPDTPAFSWKARGFQPLKTLFE